MKKILKDNIGFSGHGTSLLASGAVLLDTKLKTCNFK